MPHELIKVDKRKFSLSLTHTLSAQNKSIVKKEKKIPKKLNLKKDRVKSKNMSHRQRTMTVP